MSPFKNSNICIATDNLANDASTSSWVALSLAKITLASSNAAVNSVTTAGTTLSNCSSVTLPAISTAICNAVLLTAVSSAFTKASLASCNTVIALSTSSCVAFTLYKTSFASFITFNNSL